MRFAELVKRLYREDKNILVADTCLLLDVLRAPARDTMHIVETALRIDRHIQKDTLLQKDTLPFILVLPSPFRQEWDDNLASARNDLTQFLNDYQAHAKRVQALHKELFSSPLIIPDVTLFQFETNLEQVCQRLLASAYTVQRQQSFELKAMARARANRAPARRGKSVQDCVIFEETMELGARLRSKGFAKKIVFASSNTRDYCEPPSKTPKPDIVDDLRAVGGEFAVSLTPAYYSASS